MDTDTFNDGGNLGIEYIRYDKFCEDKMGKTVYHGKVGLVKIKKDLE